MNHKYYLRVFFSEEDNCYIAEVPELRNCSGLGKTPEIAIKEAYQSIDSWISVAKKEKIPVPQPIIKSKVSRLNLRLPSEIIHKVKMEAVESGLSLNQYMLNKLAGN